MERRIRVDSVSGDAIAKIKMRNGPIQFTVMPGSNGTGTGTVTCMPEGADDYETVYDKDGVALTVDMSVQSTHIVAGAISRIRVTSDASTDNFTLLLAV